MGCLGEEENDDPAILEFMNADQDDYIQESIGRLTRYRGSLFEGRFVLGKQPNDVVLVHASLAFRCPSGHEIRVPYAAIKSIDALKKMDAVEFSLQCPECDWKGALKGSHRTSLSLPE